MSTTTTTLAHSSCSYTTAMMLPTSDQVDPADLQSFSRIVRFDSECVLIPDNHRTKSPRMLTKSYSLPLWKRRNTPSSDTEPTAGEEAPLPSSPGETHVVLNIPIPTFISRARSPPRGRSPSMSPTTPLSPCLVQRTNSASPVSHYKRPVPARRPSMPIYHRHKDESALTIPLRACCPDCERITEECLKEGEQWQEKFTKGARRRRSASLDNATPYASTSTSPAGFTAIAAVTGSGTVCPAVVPTLRTNKFALTVDEVDKRRKSQEFTHLDDDPTRTRTLSNPSAPTYHCPAASPYNISAPPLRLSRSHHADFSSGSTSSSADSNTLSVSTSPVHSSMPPRSSPIQEEDEAQLFPLPKRSPSTSPRTSPLPSPNGSSASLPVTGGFATAVRTAASRSKESLSSRGSDNEDVKLKSPLSRKCSKGLLVPPTNTHRSGSSGTPPQSPKKGLHCVADSPDLEASSTASPPDLCAGSSSPLIATPELSSPPALETPSTPPTRHGLALHLHFPTRHHQHSNSSPVPIHYQPVEMDTPSSPTSPTLTRTPSSPKQRKQSFTHQFMRASEAMLKGVSSMGGGGGGIVGSV